MRTRYLLGALSPALLLLFAGCGATVAATSNCPGVANSAPTINQGLVTIATDHADYATSAQVVATITNKTGQPIYTYNHKTSCTVLALEQQVNGEWVAPSKMLAGCAQGTPTGLVELAPNTPLTATLNAGYLRTVPWPAGTYRLALTYYTSRTDIAQGGVTIYSQSFTTTACGSAPVATGSSSGVPATTAQPGGGINAQPQR